MTRMRSIIQSRLSTKNGSEYSLDHQLLGKELTYDRLITLLCAKVESQRSPSYKPRVELSDYLMASPKLLYTTSDSTVVDIWPNTQTREKKSILGIFSALFTSFKR